jgi:hypothetical protein
VGFTNNVFFWEKNYVIIEIFFFGNSNFIYLFISYSRFQVFLCQFFFKIGKKNPELLRMTHYLYTIDHFENYGNFKSF